MTGGQGSLTLSAESDTVRSRARQAAPVRSMTDIRIVVIKASEEETGGPRTHPGAARQGIVRQIRCGEDCRTDRPRWNLVYYRAQSCELTPYERTATPSSAGLGGGCRARQRHWPRCTYAISSASGPEALAEFPRRARCLAARYLAAAHHASELCRCCSSLARAVDLSERIAAMFRGDPINTTEQRAVLHTALRSDFAGSPAIQAEVRASRQKLKNYVAAVRSGQKVGVTGKKFRHVVNIGIGGSDLGPLVGMRCAAARSGAAISRRTSCPTSTAPSSRI